MRWVSAVWAVSAAVIVCGRCARWCCDDGEGVLVVVVAVIVLLLLLLLLSSSSLSRGGGTGHEKLKPTDTLCFPIR